MKVLLARQQFFPSSYYGIERYTPDIAHSLVELGHQVTTLQPVYPLQYPDKTVF